MVLDRLDAPTVSMDALGTDAELRDSREFLPFNPRLDITPNQWKQIIEHVNTFDISSENSFIFANWARGIKVIAPEKLKEIDSLDQIIDSAVERKKELKERAENASIDWDHYAYYLDILKHLDKSKIEEHELEFDNLELIKEDLIIEYSTYSSSNQSFLSFGKGVEILDPGSMDKLFSNGDIDRNELADVFKKWVAKERVRGYYSWEELSFFLACFRIIDAKNFQEIEIASNDWSRMRKEFSEDIKNNRFPKALSLAYNMSIIAADKVEITEDGLQLTFNSQVDQSAPILPIERNY
jgi:hypothetical protein